MVAPRTLIVFAFLHPLPQCHGLARAARENSARAAPPPPHPGMMPRMLRSIVPPSPSRRRRQRQQQRDDEDAGGGEEEEEEDEDEPLPRRRVVVLAAHAAAVVSSLLPNDGAVANAAVAAAAETPSEALRLLSSRTIPGLGPPDVYYPPYFVGRWRVTRVIANSDDDFWNEMNREYGANILPVRVVHEMRFVPRDAGRGFGGDVGDVGDSVPAIADRSFNERSYYSALSEELDRLHVATTRERRPPSILSSSWDPSNPNVLSIDYDDGSSTEIRVTKRSFDVGRDGGGVFSSEFRRITTVPPSSPSGGIVVGGIPSVYKSRVLTKWKRGSVVGAAAGGSGGGGGDVNIIEGMEIVYNERGTLGDGNVVDPSLGGGGVRNNNGATIPSLYGGDTKDLPDWRSTKTKILMHRIV
ncbi:hypothetical protein ACHAW5_005912 [Stephanodiscus triporus]|uniref:DUF6816 domain-containing protein n=1 Tax=Stephanodiscus triporus TaxID=2934178 RepID=A0ABD3NC46_9STRA